MTATNVELKYIRQVSQLPFAGPFPWMDRRRMLQVETSIARAIGAVQHLIGGQTFVGEAEDCRVTEFPFCEKGDVSFGDMNEEASPIKEDLYALRRVNTN